MSAPTLDDLKTASQTAVLSGLSPRIAQTFLAHSSVVDLEPGESLFRQGEAAVAFFIVIQGWIKLYRITPAGDEAVLHVLTKGESFAEAVAFAGGRYPATASAATDSRVVLIPAHHVMCCIRQMPDIAIAMIASTSQHLHRLVQRCRILVDCPPQLGQPGCINRHSDIKMRSRLHALLKPSGNRLAHLRQRHFLGLFFRSTCGDT